jgi:serine protease AprX
MCWPTAVHSVRAATIGFLFALALAALAAPAPAASRASTPTTSSAPTHVVQLRPVVSLAEGAAIVRAAGGRVARRLPIIHGLAASLPAGAGTALVRHPAVSGITVNARMRNSSAGLDGEEPAAASSGEEPATASDGEEPATASASEEPATASDGEEPTAASAGEEPTTASAGEEPATASDGEEPTTASAGEEPTTASAGEEPTTASAGEEPTTASASEEPTTVSASDDPAASSASDEPVTDALESGALRTAYPDSVLAPQAWASATGAGVRVAVIDTGIDGTLPDFWDRSGASRVIASVVTNPGAATAGDSYGHGTHVAGIIAGDGRNRTASDPVAGRYVGIAPEADLISVKVGDDDGNATILDVIYGLQFVVDHKDAYNIRVVNLSLESTVAQSYRTDPLDAAVESAHFHGILVVAAAGNRGATPEAANFAPGNDPFALTVGAVDDRATADRSDDAYTEWSSVGRTQDGFSKPEIAAPGSQIVSTLAGGSDFASLCPSCIVDDEYIRAGGTSMAAPVVSGVAALVFQRHPDWTPDEVKSTLIATARNLGGGVDEVNASAAVAAETPSPGTSAGIVPNDLVDASSGAIDYTRSSWSRSSWSTAPESLIAGWARSSWSCACFVSEGDAIDPTRSSWSRSSWSRSSWSTKWNY